ncbi:MAG TPA: hypothetical protein VEH81_05390 [Ktedonobacteraceae bacterium]|nr:hypothetical protein [Ktedonobacteraceae bacterium]
MVKVSGNGDYYGEGAWNTQGATGGGISHFWTMPTWQQGTGITNYESGTPCNAPGGSFCRVVPDIALNEGVSGGYPVYCSVVVAHCSSTGNWYTVGGTSAAAPMWAAWMDMVNEMSSKQGGLNLGFINPLLNNIFYSSTGSSSFHTPAAGTPPGSNPFGSNNDYLNQQNGKYTCKVNDNPCTGLGSYVANGLFTNIVALAQSKNGSRTSPANTTWYFAEGSVGGGFQEFLTMQNPDPANGANVNVSYLFQTRSAVVIPHTVPASSRFTDNLNQDLGTQPTNTQQAISAIAQVTSWPGIVVERPMYFNFKGIQRGTDVLGFTGS